MYVDAHIHLYAEEYRDTLEYILEEAKNNKVEFILSVSEDYNTSLKNLELRTHKVLIGLGVHPWTAIYKPEEVGKCKMLIEKNIDKINAIGEVGLDKKYDKSIEFWDRQVKVFEEMIELALKYNKTLNIHSRKAANDVAEILYKKDVDKAYFHWFTDDIEVLKKVIDMGYYVGFTPSLLYSRRIQKMLEITPLERILTETDGPVRYYGPLKNELTRPSHVVLLVEKISEIKNENVLDVARKIRDNFLKLFY